MTCVFCGGSLVEFRRIPTEGLSELMIADPSIREELPYLIHVRCQACRSILAADGRMDRIDLNIIYKNLPEDYWTPFIEARSGLKGFYGWVDHLLNPDQTPLTIGDIGCGDGFFLENLGSQWRRIGIEPGANALDYSDRNGVRFINGTLESSGLDEHSFDVLTYFDVIEHLPDINRELQMAGRFLKSGGKLLIFTGNATSWSARAAADRWAYLNYVGHIAIPSEKGLRLALQSNGFAVTQTIRLSHPLHRSFIRWVVTLLASRFLRVGRATTLFRDHQLVIARKIETLAD